MQKYLAELQIMWRRATKLQPLATLSVIALLALGAGGLTAVFNPIYSTIFAPLPFPHSEELTRITNPDGRSSGNTVFNFGDSSFRFTEVLDRVFSNIFAYSQGQTQIRIPDTNRRMEVNTLIVSDGFFETLGVKPLIGNDCSRAENSGGYVVSFKFWRNEFAQNPAAIGSYVESLRGEDLARGVSSILPIIGVMPEKFNFPYDTDIWQCVNSGNRWYISGGDRQIVGRLRPGISARRAMGELESIMINGEPFRFQLESLQIYLYGDQRPMLRILGIAAILFLALVCAGVVNLIIAQGTKRKQEIAIRLVHGASRRSLVFQMLRETLPLVVISGLAGWWLSEMASAWMLAQMPALRGGEVDAPVKIAFLSALALFITLIGGLVPSLYATSIDLNTYLKSAADDKKRFLSTRELLVGAQLSLSLALLIGTGVLIRSMMFNVDIPIGWSSRDIAVVSVSHAVYSPSSGAPPRSIRLINQDIQTELRTIPEVLTAGAFDPVPFSEKAVKRRRNTQVYKNSRSINYSILTPGKPPDWDLNAATVSVSPEGFELLKIPLVLGRSFKELDAVNAVVPSPGRVNFVIVNQVFTERMWFGENPIGKIFYSTENTPYEVVGVVRNYHDAPGNKDFVPTLYVPYAGQAGNSDFLVRLRPGASFRSFHTNARERLSIFPLNWVEAKNLDEFVKSATVNQNLTLQLLGVFAILGIIVSGLAVWASATLMASARIKEMGIRMAMGASVWNIFNLALLRGIRAIIIGLPFGLFMAWILTKVLSSFLVQVNIADPLVWLISCAVLLVIATVAALIPALRTVCISPIEALRDK